MDVHFLFDPYFLRAIKLFHSKKKRENMNRLNRLIPLALLALAAISDDARQRRNMTSRFTVIFVPAFWRTPMATVSTP
jgi:tellurite resistance protein TehA-like permease